MNRIIECNGKGHNGFSLIELMVVVAIIGILAVIGNLMLQSFTEKAKVKRAISEISSIQLKIKGFDALSDFLPHSLADIEGGNVLDPWGNPYRYTNFDTAPKGQWRKDRNLVPLNTDYDLWSMGKDGKSKPPLTAEESHDDIIRANDGAYIGRASEY